MGSAAARETLPLATLARMTAEDFLRGRRELPLTAASELASAIEIALLTAVRAERRACVAECTRRGDLWQKTAERGDVNDVLRLEAEHRENEARYLADSLATRT